MTTSELNVTALTVATLWKQGMASYPDVAARWEPKGDIWDFVEGHDGHDHLPFGTVLTGDEIIAMERSSSSVSHRSRTMHRCLP